jgi:DMSO/TMAO reductase YedYZ molybdopterin-dependent catalytic subunit
LAQIKSIVTPNELFFIRNHFPPPDPDIAGYGLRVTGHVEQAITLSYPRLNREESFRQDVTLECAGNLPHGGMVSDAVWEGVGLGSTLALARPKPGAAWVYLEGADQGEEPELSGSVNYSRIIPLWKCQHPGSMLAMKMNGEPLPQVHGFPVRALIPGWYGMASVKWLTRLVVLQNMEDMRSFHTREMYLRHERRASGRAVMTQPLTETAIKSVIAFPSEGMILPAGKLKTWGFAWAGEKAIRSVECSFDGGETWHSTLLANTPGPYRWVRWAWEMDIARGKYALMARATDVDGNPQPREKPSQILDGYGANWVEPIHCSVI